MNWADWAEAIGLGMLLIAALFSLALSFRSPFES